MTRKLRKVKHHVKKHHVHYKAVGDLTILVVAAWIAEGFKPVLFAFLRLH